MSILLILGQGMLLLSLLFIAGMRWRRSGPPSASRERVPLDQLPDSQTLSGIPLRILLTERSGPGPLLRDMLHVRPDAGDYSRPRHSSPPSDEGSAFTSSTSSIAMWSVAPYR